MHLDLQRVEWCMEAAVGGQVQRASVWLGSSVALHPAQHAPPVLCSWLSPPARLCTQGCCGGAALPAVATPTWAGVLL